MIKLFAGLGILGVGLANIVRSRHQPPLINAAMLKKLGFVGVGVGVLLVVAGIAELLGAVKS